MANPYAYVNGWLLRVLRIRSEMILQTVSFAVINNHSKN